MEDNVARGIWGSAAEREVTVGTAWKLEEAWAVAGDSLEDVPTKVNF